MKIKLPCHTCEEICNIHIQDEKSFFVYKCSGNHKNTLLIQSHMSEILFDRACMFLQKGYYRESIFNFFGSLEKFREMFITYALIMKNISSEKIKQFLKENHLSERQHGAYRLIQLLEGQIDSSGKPKWEDMAKLRNKVIHAGRLPAKDDAYKFGADTLKLIEHNYSYLRNKENFLITLATERFLQSIPEGTNPTVTILSPGFQLIGLNDKNYSFELILDRIKKFIESPNSWYCDL